MKVKRNMENDMKYCDLIKIAIESHMATYQRLLKSPQLGLFERKEYNNVINACKDCLSIIQDILNKTPDELKENYVKVELFSFK